MTGDFTKRFTRCLTTYRRLSCGAVLTVAQLSRDYGVSIRTIQRDLNALSMAGYSIIPALGKGTVAIDKARGTK